jgi:hypothetical protein
MAWWFIATNAPGQPIAASHWRRSWRLSAPFRVSHASLSIIQAHLVVRKNTQQDIGYGAAQTQKWVRIKEARIWLTVICIGRDGQQAGGTRAWLRKPMMISVRE